VREIDDDEGRRLVRIIRRGSGSVVTWRRAQMVLLSAQGMDVPAIAKVAFTSEDRVRDVIRNFNADGFDSLYPRYKVLAATLSAHRSAPFGVHVLAGFAGDEGSGLAVTGAGEEAGERVDGVEQERVDLGLLIGGVLGAVAAGKAVPLCGLLLLVLGGLVSGLISGLPPAQCLGAGQAAGGGLRVSAGRLVSRG
jgi:hypothetical protein